LQRQFLKVCRISSSGHHNSIAQLQPLVHR